MHEATQLLADPNLRGYGWHYEVRVRVDHAQRALNREMKARREAYPEEDADSLRWAVYKVEDGPHVLPPHLQPR
jgi:hypothetical protein